MLERSKVDTVFKSDLVKSIDYAPKDCFSAVNHFISIKSWLAALKYMTINVLQVQEIIKNNDLYNAKILVP